nr:putative leucine-rich repeat receptor-like serine/threonine-protein kinase At2g14440 [Tanacetum cinerariifolium]
MVNPLSLHIFILVLLAAFTPSYQAPYALRISCGARNDVHTPPTNTLWYRDYGYSGGYFTNATRPSFITPPLTTLRYFPLSEGPENCYRIERIPHGHYSVRIFYGLVKDPTFDNEPLFDVSVEGTLVYSLSSGWSNHDDEQAFVEALVFLEDGTATICFHSTGHGDPAVISIEILQVGNHAYYFGPEWGRGTILRTHKRLSCGAKAPKFDVDYSGNHWGGDRFWNSISTFGQNSDEPLTTKNAIKLSTNAPNYYPEALYQTSLVSTDSEPDLTCTLDVDPNRNYSVWLHFAEIDPLVKGAGERAFDILINGDTVFQEIDVANMSGGVNSALVLNATVAVSGRSLTITMHPVKGSHAIISAIEIFEIVRTEAKTLIEEAPVGCILLSPKNLNASVRST